jgi:hypothetical protein
VGNNIVQEFLLNKRQFELRETPQVYYLKKYPLTENLNIILVVVFNDYDIKFAKYLYFQDKYCCFEVMPEKIHNCKNVTELFEYVKHYDTPIPSSSLYNQLQIFKETNSDKLFKLQAESNELLKTVTGAQRAMSMFDRESADYARLSNKLNNIQTKLTRNTKEIGILELVQKDLNQFS